MIVLAIGVNNFPFNTVDEIVLGIEKVIEQMEEKFPRAKIILLGPLPTGLKADSERRKKYNRIQKSIVHLGNKASVHYYNMINQFSDEQGHLKNDYYSGDGIHLKPQGYNVWGQFIREKYNELIKE